jgi:hypothetical protein
VENYGRKEERIKTKRVKDIDNLFEANPGWEVCKNR